MQKLASQAYSTFIILLNLDNGQRLNNLLVMAFGKPSWIISIVELGQLTIRPVALTPDTSYDKSINTWCLNSIHQAILTPRTVTRQ
jgi:hypothetical protein